MAKRRKPRRSYLSRFRRFRRRGGDKRIPILPLVGVANAFVNPAPTGRSFLQDAQEGNFMGMIDDVKARFTGLDSNNNFRMDWLIATYLPIIVGFAGSKLASAVGVNKAMKRIPLVGRYIKL